MQLASEEQTDEITQVCDAMLDTLVGHTRDPNIGLSAIVLLLSKVLLMATHDKDRAISDFKAIGIPMIEATIGSALDIDPASAMGHKHLN